MSLWVFIDIIVIISETKKIIFEKKAVRQNVVSFYRNGKFANCDPYWDNFLKCREIKNGGNITEARVRIFKQIQ